VQLLDGKGNFLPESKRNLPTPKVSLFKVFGQRFSHIAPYYASRVKNDNEGKVSILVGAFMFLEKKKYIEAGGFDERYFMYGEDIDFSYKIEQLGYENYYYGKEGVIHFKGESSFKDKEYRKRFFGAMRLFYNKYFQSSFLMNALVFTGIKMVSVLKSVDKTAASLSFSKVFVVSENDDVIQGLNSAIKIRVGSISEEELFKKVMFKDPVVCFLDMRNVAYEKAIHLIKHLKNANIYFRFLPKSTQFALRSDTSNGLGIVISY